MSINIFDLPLVIENCPCGQTHRCDMRKIVCGENALLELPRLLGGCETALLVSDTNTYAAAGERAQAILHAAGLSAKELIFPGDTLLIPDEHAVSRLTQALDDSDGTVVVAVGSGVIGDLCKYVCMEKRLPQVTVATAPSMDGYASSVAAMIFKGKKVSFTAAPPAFVLGDIDILRNAPLPMLVSGIGDIVGKLSCLCDWDLSHAINGEPLCRQVYTLVREQVDVCLSAIDGVLSREKNAVNALFSALCAAGIGMSLAGSSRPASGSEHHMAHYFEVAGLREGTPYLLHGVDVVYATAVTAFLRERLCKDDRLYSINAADTVAEILRQCPSESAIWDIINKTGLSMTHFFSFYGKQRIREAILLARTLKDRYTLFTLLYDLGLLEEYADAFIAERV